MGQAFEGSTDTEQGFLSFLSFSRREACCWCLTMSMLNINKLKHCIVVSILVRLNIKLFVSLYTVFQKKTSTHIIGYKLSSSYLILIILTPKFLT